MMNHYFLPPMKLLTFLKLASIGSKYSEKKTIGQLHLFNILKNFFEKILLKIFLILLLFLPFSYLQGI